MLWYFYDINDKHYQKISRELALFDSDSISP